MHDFAAVDTSITVLTSGSLSATTAMRMIDRTWRESLERLDLAAPLARTPSGLAGLQECPPLCTSAALATSKPARRLSRAARWTTYQKDGVGDEESRQQNNRERGATARK